MIRAQIDAWLERIDKCEAAGLKELETLLLGLLIDQLHKEPPPPGVRIIYTEERPASLVVVARQRQAHTLEIQLLAIGFRCDLAKSLDLPLAMTLARTFTDTYPASDAAEAASFARNFSKELSLPTAAVLRADVLRIFDTHCQDFVLRACAAIDTDQAQEGVN